MRFRKFHATGNSFLVFIDDFRSFSPELRRRLCSPQYGIGADGIVAICMNAAGEETEFEMFYWNADGELGTFCGNGARVAVWLAYERTGKRYFRFRAADGLHEGWILQEEPVWIGVTLMLRQPPQMRPGGGFWVNTGSPHLLLPANSLDELRSLSLDTLARPLRWETTYDPGGVNVSYYTSWEDGYAIRTYERGVEAETQSCGTAAVALAALSQKDRAFLYPLGGQLVVSRLSDTGFRLEGPVVEIAQGTLFIGS